MSQRELVKPNWILIMQLERRTEIAPKIKAYKEMQKKKKKIKTELPSLSSPSFKLACFLWTKV